MKKIALLFASLSYFTCCLSQELHSPAELLKIMTDSKLSYEIKILDKPIECKDLSNKLNTNNLYRVGSGSELSTHKFDINDKAKPLFDKAESFFQSNNADSALEYYKLGLLSDSSYYNAMTYIGQIYGSRGDYNNAITWYKKAIKNNYIDYMAHWFLADSYLEIKDLNNAVEEIVIARILNRNNPRIKKSMITIFEKVKRNTEDWCFNPQMELSQISEDKISIAIDDKWTGYAIAKALWTYEPGYSDSMGVPHGQYSTIEDKECLFSLLVGIENSKAKIKNDPQLRILKEATEKKLMTEYIVYEIVLPENPIVAFQLPEETILGIKDYILNIRNTK